MAGKHDADETAYTPDPPPRIPPVRPEQFTDEMRAFFDKWTVGEFKDAGKYPPLMTYAHHPLLADTFSQLNIHVLTTSTLSVKHRQLAIMRTAWVTNATYVWSSHLKTSQILGLSDEMYAPIQSGPDDPYFTEFERAIVRATDELVHDRDISNDNWKILAGEWSVEQMLDFLFAVGTYVLTASVLRTIGVQRGDELLALAAKYGAPAAIPREEK